MSRENDIPPTDLYRKFVIGFLAAVLLLAFVAICLPFLRSVCWAAIVVMGIWPLHVRLGRLMPGRPAVTAALSTCLMGVVLVAILVPVVLGIGPELRSAGVEVVSYLNTHEDDIRESISRLPWVGKSLSAAVGDLDQSTSDLMPLLESYSQAFLGKATTAAQGLFSFFFNLMVFIFAMFFLLYYGDDVTGQLQRGLLKMDSRTGPLIVIVQKTVLGVLFGMLITAVAQGALAGLGFAVAGVRAPILLGTLTVFLSFIPYGPQAIYLPAAMMLVASGSPVKGVLLALWGFLVVSSADNVLKPLFIASQVRLPLPLVLMGVVGGLLQFGLLGVFVGPVVVGLVQNLWLAWTQGVAEPGEAEASEPRDDSGGLIEESPVALDSPRDASEVGPPGDGVS